MPTEEPGLPADDDKKLDEQECLAEACLSCLFAGDLGHTMRQLLAQHVQDVTREQWDLGDGVFWPARQNR